MIIKLAIEVSAKNAGRFFINDWEGNRHNLLDVVGAYETEAKLAGKKGSAKGIAIGGISGGALSAGAQKLLSRKHNLGITAASSFVGSALGDLISKKMARKKWKSENPLDIPYIHKYLQRQKLME